MHMADALISPIVGGTMMAAATGVAAYSVNKLKNELTDKKIPLMGVMGAFIFAAQMINFSIPGTGSSGHIGGGMLLVVLLGPFAGFLTMTSILLIQALFFGDGGLLAFGCNVINLGFFTCFISYPLIFKPIIKNKFNIKRIFIGSILSVIIGLQLGAFSVVLETVISGKTEIPFGAFFMVMQPIHLAIGLVEGVITGSVVVFIWKQRPEILLESISINKKSMSFKKILLIFIVSAIVLAGGISWFASENPDGLEWSLSKVTNIIELENENAGTSSAGIIGGSAAVILAILAGFLIKIIKRKNKKT